MAKRSNDKRLEERLRGEKTLPSNAKNLKLHGSLRVTQQKEHEELVSQQVARREKEARKRAREARKRAKKEWKEKWSRKQQEEEEMWQQEARLSEEKTVIRGRLAEKLGAKGEMDLVRRLREIDLWEQVLAEHHQAATFINWYEDWYWKLYMEPASPSSSSEESPEAKGEKACLWMNQCPLIAKSQQARMLQIRKENQQRKLIEEKKREVELKGFNAIKETLELAKMKYDCHREVRLRRQADRRQLVTEKLKTELAIDLDALPDKGASVVDHYERLKRQREEMKQQQVLRKAAILEKLLLEKAARRPATKTTPLHSRRREQGTQKQIKEEIKTEDTVVSIQTNESENELEDIPTVDVAVERKDNQKENVLKDGVVTEEEVLIEGDDVDARGRHWILPQNTLGQFQRVAEEYDKLKAMRTKEIPEVGYPDDPGMTWNPRCILFKDFTAGQLYRRRVVVTNTSSSRVVCRMVKVKLSDESDPLVLQVKYLDHQRLLTGGSFSFQVEFQPEDLTPELEGEIVFRTTREPSEVRQFAVPIHCTPPRPEPSLDPLHVGFPTVPCWTRGKRGVILYRTVHVSNTGGASCTLRVMRASELLDQETAAFEGQKAICIVPEKKGGFCIWGAYPGVLS